MLPYKATATTILLMLASTVHAHTGLSLGHGFAAGLVHPWLGADHVLAMLAVGLWAGQQGDRALWGVPLAFVVMMLVGALFTGRAGPLPVVEAGILVSLLVFGGLIAFNARPPFAIGVTIAALFAFFHGFAHATEMPASTVVLAYLSGLVASSALLQVVGINLARFTQVHRREPWLRTGGAVIVVSGLVLWLG